MKNKNLWNLLQEVTNYVLIDDKEREDWIDNGEPEDHIYPITIELIDRFNEIKKQFNKLGL